MKVEGVPGIYYAQAFLYTLGKRVLCGCFHSGLKEVLMVHDSISKIHVEWPVEIDNAIAYVPSKEELENEN